MPDHFAADMPMADTSLVTNDLERWIADTYALWSACAGENWRLLGGYPRDEDNAAMLKELLERDWGITSLAEGIGQVNLLAAGEFHHNPAVDGWDYCRGMQLLGIFYVAGLLDREQMIRHSCTLGKRMQGQFESWDALCRSYLAGFEQWCLQNFSPAEAEKRIRDRRDKYEALRRMKDGPYRLPWKMELDPASAARPAGGCFEAWLRQEEAWIRDYRRKAGRTLLIVWPSVIATLAVFFIALGLVSGARSTDVWGFPIVGAAAGVLVMLPVHWFVMRRLRKGRMSRAIQGAAKRLGMDDREREALGMEMLAALQDRRCRLDYEDRPPSGQKTPARLLVSGNYFYQAGGGMYILLIRRSDVDYIEAGQERRTRNVSSGTARSVMLYTVCFYFRSSRERRLETDQSPDAGMGFFDPALRNRAFAMIDRQLQRVHGMGR